MPMQLTRKPTGFGVHPVREGSTRKQRNWRGKTRLTIGGLIRYHRSDVTTALLGMFSVNR